MAEKIYLMMFEGVNDAGETYIADAKHGGTEYGFKHDINLDVLIANEIVPYVKYHSYGGFPKTVLIYDATRNDDGTQTQGELVKKVVIDGPSY